MGAIVGHRQEPSVLERYLARTPRLAFYAFSLSAFAIMCWAWTVRDYRYIQAESGIGYALGIIGGSLMLILLLYPLRKRVRFMRGWLNIRTWFRLHMVLGILGPACILLHCNFHLGSTNSGMALYAMLLVSGSGLIGRYLYGKFHYGLYGKQVRLAQVKSDLDAFYSDLDKSGLTAEQNRELETLYLGCSKIVASQRKNVTMANLLRQRRWLRAQMSQLTVANEGLYENYVVLAALLEKLAGLRLFERLFSVWHVVHIPVFLLMVVTAIVHVVVVHWY